ncbi:hypothetical protein AB3S75_022149 [Citrus x aurantiifolia]
MLKTQFHNHPKGIDFQPILFDLLGDGIFNSDGDKWKFQRQVSSHEFNTKSLRKFVETVVETELSDPLFISSQRPPLTKPFLIFKICCNGSRLLTFARLLSGTILNTCRHLCHKQSSQELLMMLSRQARNDSVSLYVYSGKSKGFSILVLRNVSKLQSVKYGNLLKT